MTRSGAFQTAGQTNASGAIPAMPLETGPAVRTMPLLLPHDSPSSPLMIHPNIPTQPGITAIQRRSDQDRPVPLPFPY